MNIEQIRDYALQKQAVRECLPFDAYNLVFKCYDKMFLLLPLDDPYHISLKCDPERAIELREQYEGIEGAFHFNKKYWNRVYLTKDLPEALIYELIDHSYDEVVKKISLKKRNDYSL